MTADEYREELSKLIKKAPRPEAIASVKTARAFKEVAMKAQKISGKSLMQLQTIFNTPRSYY